MLSPVTTLLHGLFNLSLPYGLTFGGLIMFVWSLPLLPRLIRSVF